MKLIIAEKPDLAKAIAKAIEGKEEYKKGYIEKGDFYITWAIGHLFKLKSPEEYNQKYKEWKLEDLPIFFKNWEIVPVEDKKNQIENIKKLLEDNKVTEIINAGDVDEEGQFLIDEILLYFKNNKPVKRILVNDLTENSIKKSLENLKNNKDFENLGKSAYARAVADFMVGINLSRFFTKKNNTKLTIGRVQTPTLAMIVNRDENIKNHSKEKYYEFFTDIELIKSSNPSEKENFEKLKLEYDSSFADLEKKEKIYEKIWRELSNLSENEKIKFKYVINKKYLDDGEKYIKEKNIYTNIEDVLKSKKSFEIRVKKEILKEKAPLPFNLATLQIYFNEKYNYSPDETMKITQSLRENYQAITYNRSDSQYLSEEQYLEAPELVKIILKNRNIEVSEMELLKKSRAFDDSKITAHTAIIPSNLELDLTSLNEKERNVYEAISNYYLAQFLPDVTKEKTTAEITILDENDFQSSSTRIIDYGYKNFLRDKEDKEEEKTILSKFMEGNYKGNYRGATIEEKETKPLKYYTEATIIKDMTAISKYVEDENIKKILKEKDKEKKGENGSIGTPATRSSILQNLFDKGYIEKIQKKVVSTELGRNFINSLPKELTTPELTAKWWLIQEEIRENGETTKLTENVLEAIKNIISKNYEIVSNSVKENLKEEVGKCPICKNPVYQGKTKTGKINYYCSDYKNGCAFSLWEEMKHFSNELTITKTKAKQLLKENGKAQFKLKNKDGKEYEAFLKLKIVEIKDKKYINFEIAGYPNKDKK